MLILSRKTNESIVIDGRIVVKIVRVEGETVKVGIQAPADVPVHRQEVYLEVQGNNQEALTHGRPAVPRLTRQTPPALKQSNRPVSVSPGHQTAQNKPQPLIH